MKFAVPMRVSIMFEIEAATAEEAIQKVQSAINDNDDTSLEEFEEIRKEFSDVIDCRYIEVHDADILEEV